MDGDRREPFGARLNVGAIIALGAFGAFIFLAAIITTVVILVRRYVSYIMKKRYSLLHFNGGQFT